METSSVTGSYDPEYLSQYYNQQGAGSDQQAFQQQAAQSSSANVTPMVNSQATGGQQGSGNNYQPPQQQAAQPSGANAVSPANPQVTTASPQQNTNTQATGEQQGSGNNYQPPQQQAAQPSGANAASPANLQVPAMSSQQNSNSQAAGGQQIAGSDQQGYQQLLTQLPSATPSGIASAPVWDSQQSAGKTQLYNYMHQQGASDFEIAEVEGLGEVETNDFNTDQHDPSKDGTPSQTYSAFNVNGPQMQALGWNKPLSALNDQNNIGEVGMTLLNGMRSLGFNTVSGWSRLSPAGDMNSQDVKQWNADRSNDAAKIAQLYLSEGPAILTNNQRVATASSYE